MNKYEIGYKKERIKRSTGDDSVCHDHIALKVGHVVVHRADIRDHTVSEIQGIGNGLLADLVGCDGGMLEFIVIIAPQKSVVHAVIGNFL